MNLEEQLRDLIDLAPPHIQRHFACDCAERVLRRVKMKDKRSWKAIEAGRCFAEGRAELSELSDAWSAALAAAWDARAAAWAATSAAASAAASDAAWAAARAAAWATARDAAWAAAWAAARDAARDAASDAASDAARAAARATARAAAWEEEQKWQLAHLQSMISNHNEARSSLLYILQQRAESIKPIFAQYAHSLEERVFE